MIGDTATRVLLTVMAQDRPTVASVAAALGVAKSTAHRHLVNLHGEGLVEYGAGKQGHLRALVGPQGLIREVQS